MQENSRSQKCPYYETQEEAVMRDYGLGRCHESSVVDWQEYPPLVTCGGMKNDCNYEFWEKETA